MCNISIIFISCAPYAFGFWLKQSEIQNVIVSHFFLVTASIDFEKDLINRHDVVYIIITSGNLDFAAVT